eukprot:SAG25_NODE_1388_length_3144_cov_1.629885_3_plen_205_part_00
MLWGAANEGCYDISVHQCDCGIPDAATCAALNEPGGAPRFFWTPGCDSCFNGRDWSFEFEDTGLPTNSTRRMAGAHYDVPSCGNADGAAAFVSGRLAVSQAGENLTDVVLGLDACCGEENPTVPDGCYDISVHQCDCGISDETTCERLNTPGAPQRFFWTPGCASCVGREVCSGQLDATLPRWFLNNWRFDFTTVCAQQTLQLP